MTTQEKAKAIYVHGDFEVGGDFSVQCCPEKVLSISFYSYNPSLSGGSVLIYLGRGIASQLEQVVSHVYDKMLEYDKAKAKKCKHEASIDTVLRWNINSYRAKGYEVEAIIASAFFLEVLYHDGGMTWGDIRINHGYWNGYMMAAHNDYHGYEVRLVFKHPETTQKITLKCPDCKEEILI